MTTCIIDNIDKKIYSDNRIVYENGAIFDDVHKAYVYQGKIAIAASGCVGLINRVLIKHFGLPSMISKPTSWGGYEKGDLCHIVIMNNYNNQLMLVTGTGLSETRFKVGISYTNATLVSIGSGSGVAYDAMTAGATFKQAMMWAALTDKATSQSWELTEL